ncbi:MAG: translation elongation factor-like protein [candidate division Zixibacteria bacterium RBG_16_48_11]|nr:MAG: translation elongation factor-like protein [candidate division Zixibacteria bacterium RBG_16_48_11]
MPEELVGKVTDYFAKIGVIALELSATLKVGDKIHIKGHTTDFEQNVDSIQIEHKSVPEAGAGASVGIKVKEHCRHNDQVYKVIPDN